MSRLSGRTVATWRAADGLPSDQVLALAEDDDGRVWAGTASGVAVLTGGGVDSVLTEARGFPRGEVWALCWLGNELWIGTRSGLARFDGDRVTAVNLGPRGNPWIQAVLPRRAGGVWVGAEDGLYLVADSTPRRVARSGWIRGMVEDGDGSLWFGSSALRRLSRDALEQGHEPEVLASEPVRSVLEDREGSLWVGTDGGGLRQLHDGPFTTFGTDQGLPSPGAYTITEDRAGTLWVGTLSGLARFHDGFFTEVTRVDGQPFGFVTALHVDRSGVLWVGHDGLSRNSRGRMVRVAASDGLPSSWVQAIVDDREGRLWVGTAAGLARLDGDRLVSFTTAEGLAGNDVRCLVFDPAGALWIGTLGGLSRYRDGVFDSYTSADGLPQDDVRDVYPEPDGTLWIGTYGGGLVRLKDGAFAAVTRVHGLPDNVVSRILADDAGFLWLTSNRGVAKVRLEALERVADGKAATLDPQVLGVADGMASSECNGGFQPAGWRASDGRLWLPTIAGVVTVNPAAISALRLTPPVAIERVLVDGKIVDSQAEVVMPPGRRTLTVHYTGLSLVTPERVRFRYRLEGLEQTWVEAGGRRVAHYAAVPPGRYRFHVIAANRDGVWNQTGASPVLVAEPAFHETTGFVLLCGAGLVLLGAGLYAFRVRRLRRRQVELETLVRKRTRELEERQVELASLNANLSQMVEEQTGEIRRTRDVAIITLARLAELRDDDTGRHMERIGSYCSVLVRALRSGSHPDISDEFIAQLCRSSPLHDIGKVAIPDVILRKPGPLTESEQELMRTHCQVGGDVLRSVLQENEGSIFLAMAMEIAMNHHEHWDGTGYPRGLAGTSIPLSARIVALADVYDAIRSRRPYKAEVDHQTAVGHIATASARHFDPDIVDCFLQVQGEFDRIYCELRPPG